jgi:hypothetical protein
MHSEADYEFAKRMIAWGMNDCAIARLMGISRGTIRDWRTGRVRAGPSSRRNCCPICGSSELNGEAYAYLLGLYLGDGCISTHPRGVYKLRVSLDTKYPGIIAACGEAIETLLHNKRLSSGRVACPGCTEVYSYWKHWPCVFPQHGAGPKHLRSIELANWQQKIADRYPHLLLRGLIHSDGCRGLNKIHHVKRSAGGYYEYPRYQFSNNSDAIRAIFCQACDAYGVAWRQMNWRTVAVSRRADVARLDEIIGPKF